MAFDGSLGQATGRGVRVAVIDSGVNSRHPHIAGVAGGVAIGADTDESPAPPDPTGYSDFLGHGTAVMAAIQELAPGAEYFAVKLFHRSLRATTAQLLEALEWAIDQRMDVINLSLGTRNPEQATRFEPLIQKATAQGSLIVAAHNADGVICYPGSLPGVISVGLDWELNREQFRAAAEADGFLFYASGYPRSLPGVPVSRNLTGISFAVANMSGFVARAAELLPAGRKLEDLCALLARESERLTAPAA